MKRKFELWTVAPETTEAFRANLENEFFKLKTQKEFDKIKKGLSFDRLESGLYRCKQTNAHWSREEIEELENQYLLMIEVVNDRHQAPVEIELLPFSPEHFLNHLLINNIKI